MEQRSIQRPLNEKEAAANLSNSGYKITPAYLQKLRSVGGGPEFFRWGRRVFYSEQALLDWVVSRTSGPLRSTSQAA